MRIKTFPLISVVLLLVILILAIYSNIIAGNFSAEKHEIQSNDSIDFDKLEDAIIIDGLKMQADKAIDSGENDYQEGAIIYDDDFYYNSPEPQKQEHKINENISKHASNKKVTIEELKKNDRRWHVTRYKIKKGDNLWTIARKFNSETRLILQINDINNPKHLNKGNIILVPNKNGIAYKIRKGDTLKSISEEFKISVKSIMAYNNIKSNIREGKQLFLPDAVKIRKPQSKINTNSDENGTYANIGKRHFWWPLRGRITSSFGNRIDPFSGSRKFHCGIDISVPPGTPVLAACDGKVIFSNWKEGYGNMVVLKHNDGYISVYAHNKNNIVSDGDEIKKGQTIALSGMTGAVTGAHLHFEIRKYLTPLNPIKFLR